MFARILALFLITPVIELALLIKVGEVIGFWPTIAIIAATGLAGAYLAKREGISAWRRFENRLATAELPGRELVDGVIILIAGALLITPGVLTDLIGFVGLIPFTRAIVRRYIDRRIRRAVQAGRMRVGFGGFDAFGSGEASSPGDEPYSDIDRGVPDWQGRRRDVPRHGKED